MEGDHQNLLEVEDHFAIHLAIPADSLDLDRMGQDLHKAAVRADTEHSDILQEDQEASHTAAVDIHLDNRLAAC